MYMCDYNYSTDIYQEELKKLMEDVDNNMKMVILDLTLRKTITIIHLIITIVKEIFYLKLQMCIWSIS